jgi:hypothetical protein
MRGFEVSRKTWEGGFMQKVLWWFTVLALLSAPGCAQPETLPPFTVAQSDAAPCPAQPENQPPAGTEHIKPTPGVEQSQPTPAPPAQARTQPLFIIERSKNANVVQYAAQLTPNGRLDPEKPVIAYWVMLAQDGHREDLNWIEKKMAYGFKLKPDPSMNEYQMTIVAAPQRSITIKKVGSAVRAEIVIDGRPAILEKIYIDASDRLIGPTVHYIELYGKDVQTAEERFEKIIPK